MGSEMVVRDNRKLGVESPGVLRPACLKLQGEHVTPG